jgi:hypothetical protein
MKVLLSVFFLVCGLCCAPAYAWTRIIYEDAVMVERSEAIVVGHLERGSVVDVQPGEGYSQYHGTLIITELLKGSLESHEIPVIIYHGLTPLTGGHIESDRMKLDLRPIIEGLREDAILIVDTGSSAFSFSSLVPDAGDDNLWFLRRRSGIDGRAAGTGEFGIVDPQDLRPLALKDYYLAYLSADPEAVVKTQMALHPEVAHDAQRYLDHLEVDRILQLPDPTARIERLIPFYVKGQSWFPQKESGIHSARQGLVESGTLSGERLMKLFDETEPEWLRADLIRLFGEIRIHGCVDRVIELLKQHDKFWSEQVLQEGWWNLDYASTLTKTRRRIFGEVLSSVVALGQIGDPRAIRAIEFTKRRWEAINFEDRQIVAECNKTLLLLKSQRASDRALRNSRSPNK